MLTRNVRLATVSGCMALGLGLALMTGCKSDAPATQAPILDASNPNGTNGGDPSDVNNAPLLDSTGAYVQPGTQQTGQQQTGTQQAASGTAPRSYYGSTAAPRTRVLGQREYPQADNSSAEEYPGYDPSYDSNVDDGQEALYANQAPPPLPEYQQPELTQPGYEWTPGYWNYANTGYYWVPGAWVPPPYQNALWTPGYWGYAGNRYRFHRGFWGLHIGFYGGIPYGFGYTGNGYHGGYWRDNSFYYNRSVNRINVVNVRNVYERNVVVEHVGSRYSYNGPGGVNVRPQPYQLAVYREQRTGAVAAQIQDRRAAESNRQQFYAVNRGRPENVVRQANFTSAYRPTAVAPMNRGGFGGQNRAGQGFQQQQNQQQNLQQQRAQQNQQRAQQDQQRAQQTQQRVQQNQQRAQQNQQRAQSDQQRAAQQQQRSQLQQQRATANQQRAQTQAQRATVDQQRGQQQQQRAQQLQQREQANQQNTQQQQQRAQQQQQRSQQLQQNAQQNQQRAQQQQERSQATQQRAQEQQQRSQQTQQRAQQTQQREQASQQQAAQQQQRAQQQQQRGQEQQQRAQQQEQRAQQQEQRSQRQAQPAPQQRAPQAQPQQRAAPPAAQPQRAAPAQAPAQAPHEEHGGGRPRG